MRGRTLNDSFIILDEAQNTTVSQMMMFLTRMGHGSKVVVTGDDSQVDLAGSVRSGLLDAKHRLRGIKGVAQVRLSGEDIVRHSLVQSIVEAYEHSPRTNGESPDPAGSACQPSQPTSGEASSDQSDSPEE